MTHKNYAELELKVIRWAEARKIIPNSTPMAQAIKTVEEAGELLQAATALHVLGQVGIAKDHPVYVDWFAKYKDANGDVQVTLINGAALADVTMVGCLDGSYDEIKDRTGHMNESGVFIKDV